MKQYVLMLESGLFVEYDQISSNEVEVSPVSYELAHTFLTLEKAREAAKTVNERYDDGFTIYSNENVVSILKSYSLE